jgi:hypothetical protein
VFGRPEIEREAAQDTTAAGQQSAAIRLTQDP